jgi:hypothetical protein
MTRDPSRLDLARCFATELALKVVSEIDFKPLVELLADYGLAGEHGRRFAFFQTVYRRSRVQHESVGSIVQVQPGRRKYQFVLTYRVAQGKVRSMGGRTKPVLDMLNLLADMPEEHQFSCEIGFKYPANRYYSCIPIPLSVADSARLPYTDIRGVHLSKMSEGASLYDIIVDHAPPELDTVLHSITIEYLAGFAVDLPDHVLRFAADISREFGELHD